VGQDGRESLDPLATVRDQVTANADTLALSGFPAARLDCFPHTLSGGEAQRAALLAALSGPPPALLLADEPTTGLDPRARRQLTAALRQYTARPHHPSVVFVTHDRRLLRGFADVVVDIGPVTARGAAPPRRRAQVAGAPLVDARGLNVHAGLTRRPGRPTGTPVLRGVDLLVAAGETVGIIGESGVGKTTLLRALAGLCASAGALSVLGADPRAGTPQGVQLLWQDPATSLDPAMALAALLGVSARLGGKRSVKEALARVGLTHRGDALAGELSGGERRRASIAQVWLAGARLVLADEPTAALDAPRAAEALTLLQDLVDGHGGIVIASHDLDLVLPLCDRVYVLHDGACVDVFTPDSAAAPARHPFTRALMEAG
jgi:ABC-type glutathione transport system ATPase component